MRYAKWVFSLLTLFAAVPAAAERVAFKSDVTTLTAKVGQEFRIEDLKIYLKDLGSGNISWSIGADAPAWVKLDSVAHKMFGNPTASDIGTKSFRLVVIDKTTNGEQSAITRVDLTVIAPPIWKTQNIDLGIQNEDLAMTPFDLTKFIDNPAGGQLTFTAVGLRPWMNLTPEGIITGTPKRIDVGDYTGITFTATGVGGASQASAFGKVLITIKAPKWVSNPIKLPDASEDANYSQGLKPFILDYENSAFTFEKTSGADWVQVNSSGSFFGTPGKAHLGQNSVTVTFRTTIAGKEYTGVTVFQVNVLHVNHAPYWVANPLVLPAGSLGLAYSQDLSGSAKDPDAGDTLTYRLVDGPSWATVSVSGALVGTPPKTQVGVNKFNVEVKDQAGLVDTTVVEINVLKSNEPPVWLTKPTVLPKGKEDSAYTVDLNSFVKDPDGDAVTFTVLSAPQWITVNPNGTLSGMPRAKQIGLNKLSVKVSDNISGSDVADLLIDIEHTNHAPEWILSPIKISVKEKSPVTFSVKPYAKDIDQNDTLTFQLLNGPSWGQLGTDGSFTGTPQRVNLGENIFSLRVIDQTAAFADVKLIVVVEKVNEKPFWTANPVLLPNAKENVVYGQSLLPFAKDPDNDPLIFTKLSGEDWIQISSDGVVSGTPGRRHVGVNSAVVRIMDPSNEIAETTIQIVVEKVNIAPRWRQDPILMVDGFEDKAYSFDLKPYAIDDDGDSLSYQLVSGPTWMKVSPDGIVSGTPKKADIGAFAAVFEVKDPSGASATTNGKGTVIKTNHPPAISNEIPTFIVKERQIFQVALKDYVTDPDGDATLNFNLSNAPVWVAMFKTGDVTLRPMYPQIGDHSFPFQVDDGELSTSGVLKVRVIRDPRPPIWLEDPIAFEAKTNQLFAASVNGKAKDLDNIAIKFSKKAGKDWLKVDSNGDLSGTPREADLGENVFTLSACNDLLCADAKLVINVKPGTQIDQIAIDQAVPGAPSDNLWIVDTSDQCSSLTQAFKKNIGYYYDILNKAQIHHSGVYLSANAKKWDGKPVYDATVSPLLLWTDLNIGTAFQKRMEMAGRDDWEARCSNCYNSPIWSMFRFYEQLPGITEIYHNKYFDVGVPMEALIVTQQRDHYKFFASGKPQASWVPTTYADSFIETHDKEMKPYRISTIAPECPSLYTEKEAVAAPENAYKVLTNKTRGDYYKSTDCNFNIKPFLEDYAKKVIFRAYVHAKNRVKLSKVPMDPSTLTLFVSGLPIKGNTGSPDDKWKYDPATNEVIIYWYLIDQGQLKPGDQIRIEYRVS